MGRENAYKFILEKDPGKKERGRRSYDGKGGMKGVSKELRIGV